MSHPNLFYPSWGGATGFAGHLIRAVKHHASFAAVIDVGCNSGDWTEMWRRSSVDEPVLCVEPLQSLAFAVKRRFAAVNRVHVINAALSNRTGTQTLYGLPKSSKSASGQTGAGLALAPSEGGHVALGTIQVDTLDRLLHKWNLFNSGRLMVKVDTEGFDIHVLLGAACALRRGVIECDSSDPRSHPLYCSEPSSVFLL